MKRSGIGEDLEATISGKKRVDASGLERKVVILSYLSEKPCSTSYSISSALKISERGVLWHLRSMVKMEIVEEMKVEGKYRFFIIEHIKREHCHIFSIMSERRLSMLFSTILERPGICHSELAEKFGLTRQGMWKAIRKLSDAEMLKEVRGGRHVRYYPSEKIKEMADTYAERREIAAEVIKSAVQKIGLDFTVIAHRNGILYLKVGEKELSFSTDPLKSSLEV